MDQRLEGLSSPICHKQNIQNMYKILFIIIHIQEYARADQGGQQSPFSDKLPYLDMLGWILARWSAGALLSKRAFFEEDLF